MHFHSVRDSQEFFSWSLHCSEVYWSGGSRCWWVVGRSRRGVAGVGVRGCARGVRVVRVVGRSWRAFAGGGSRGFDRVFRVVRVVGRSLRAFAGGGSSGFDRVVRVVRAFVVLFWQLLLLVLALTFVILLSPGLFFRARWCCLSMFIFCMPGGFRA